VETYQDGYLASW